MKKLLTIIIVVLAVFLIYLGFKDENVYYLSIGDYLANGINPYGTKDYGYSDYVKDYLNENKKLEVFVSYVSNNKRTIDIIKDIEDNVKIEVNGKKKTLQNALIKADIITISIFISMRRARYARKTVFCHAKTRRSSRDEIAACDCFHALDSSLLLRRS